MLRTNRSSVAPVALALLLLIVAAFPFSLRRADFHFGARFDSVIRAWDQIASIFLTVYQPSNAAQLLALQYSGEPDSSFQPDTEEAPQQVACLEPPAGLSNPFCGDALSADETTAERQGEYEATPMPVDSKISARDGSRQSKRRASAPPNGSQRLAVGPIAVPTLDVSEVIRLAMRNEEAARRLDTRLSDYQLGQKFELRRLLNRSSFSTSYRFVPLPSEPPCTEGREVPARPDLGPGARNRQSRTSTSPASSVQVEPQRHGIVAIVSVS